MSIRHTVVETDLGPITLVATGAAVTGLYFRHHIRRPGVESFGVESPADPLLIEAADQLRDYLAGRRLTFDLPLSARGDDFQRAVWAIVAAIPRGETSTYGRIAEQLGDRALAQRVGQAVGANPLCVFVPCHRVVGADGSLTGYAGGLPRKRALLDLEAPAPVSAGRLF
ncbi:methylated-DNA--[protein]-cysteine S-methyltransferase [Nocardia neocaledoniensis]|uniref:methylated-DNA--[protein]-cysteine S-methyltransferase n=1 Tax=Nocardia neocaledoniensis TaxID=236511 RepID=UPI002454FDB8|nr:methylated-DNA--[protein]-cysteine S-methyltransferase [Nocardia neocaledoniensis]